MMCKRLKKELHYLIGITDAPESQKESYANANKYFIFESIDENECSVTGRLLPESELYGNGSYRVKILFREYPFEAPKVIFLTKIYHPNIDNNGEICSCRITEGEWHVTRTIRDIIKFLIYLIDNPQPVIPIPLTGRCWRCEKATHPCIVPTCQCGIYICASRFPENLSDLGAFSRYKCCKCRSQLYSSSVKEHQCTLDDIKEANHYVMRRYGVVCPVNENVANECRHNKEEFLKNVKEYVHKFALPRTREDRVLSLKRMSKHVILNHLKKDQLNQLNLSPALINYLNEPSYT